MIHLGGESAKADGPVTAGGQQISTLRIESELLYFRKHHGVAGLGSFVLLAWMSDLINAFKGSVKGHSPRTLKTIGQHSLALGSTLLRTRLGTRSTR